MSKIYFSFSRLRYIDKENLPNQLMVEKIQSIIGCHFIKKDPVSGLAEKSYEALLFGCNIILEHWKFENHTIYTLSGRTIFYDNCEQEDLAITKLNNYLIDMFDYFKMSGWYIRTMEEGTRDTDLAGGEYVS